MRLILPIVVYWSTSAPKNVIRNCIVHTSTKINNYNSINWVHHQFVTTFVTITSKAANCPQLVKACGGPCQLAEYVLPLAASSNKALY
jgi:hypothetical protein